MASDRKSKYEEKDDMVDSIVGKPKDDTEDHESEEEVEEGELGSGKTSRHSGKDRERKKNVRRDERDRDRDKDSEHRSRDRERERERDKGWERDRERGKERSSRDGELKDKEKRHREKEHKKKDRMKERDRENDRDKVTGKEREKEKELNRDRDRDRERDKGSDKKPKDKDREKEKEKGKENEKKEKMGKKGLDDDEAAHNSDKHLEIGRDMSKEVKVSFIESDSHHDEIIHPRNPTSTAELEDRIAKMKDERMKKNPEHDSEILSWVHKSRKLEKEKAIKLSKKFEEQDNIGQQESDDEASHDLAGVKVLHGLEKVIDGGSVVLTLKDQSILADGDVNQDVDMLENVEIGEQKRRDEAYKAAKKKPGTYDDKFDENGEAQKKILPQYDDPIEDEGVTLDERGRFAGEAERKLQELRRRLQGSSGSNKIEDLTSTVKFSSDYYTAQEMLQFNKPKKKKSLRKKEKLNIDALEAEALSTGLGSGDLGSKNDKTRQALKEEQQRLDAQLRNKAYQTAYAKADEASKLLRLSSVAESDETEVFADDAEDLHKSLERARRLALTRQKEEGSGIQAIARLATSSNTNPTAEDQNPGNEEENRVVFTEVEEFVWGLQLDEETHKTENNDVFKDEDEAPSPSNEVHTNETVEPMEVEETEEAQKPVEDGKEVVLDSTLQEMPVGKGLSGVLNLLKERGTLKESIEWGGRNMDKKKSKLVGIVHDSSSAVEKFKDIHIERTDEFGRIMTPKEAFRWISHKFHGKGPGKMKQEKRMKQYEEELKLKQMKNSDTPSLSVERMREAQEQLKTPYLVLSGHAKSAHTIDGSGFGAVGKDIPGSLTPMIGDKKVEHFLGIKRKVDQSNFRAYKKSKP